MHRCINYVWKKVQKVLQAQALVIIMPTIRVAETYDLSTTVNKLGLIGIHTPSVALLYKLYPGMFLNYKFYHIDKCDMAIACASVQPADPLQVGSEAGEIAPQDLFNPILYRAVSNESYNTILSRLYASDQADLNPFPGGSASATANAAGQVPFGTRNTTDDYYALLGDDGWRKSMPQSGFSMTNLRPLVYSVVSAFGNGNTGYTTLANAIQYGPQATTVAGATATPVASLPIRGSAQAYPRIPTLRGQIDPVYATSSGTTDNSVQSIPTPSLNPVLKTFVAAIITPPAKQHRLYYRLRVVWTITFTDPVSIVERSSLNALAQTGISTYVDYISADTTTKAVQFENPDVSTEMVDTMDVDAEMIMQR